MASPISAYSCQKEASFSVSSRLPWAHTGELTYSHFPTVNYLITSALFGNAFEAIDGPELMPFLWELSKSASWAEIRARKSQKRQMWFGDEYSYILLQFTVTVALGISSPIIAPFGVLFLALKHAIDSHRLRDRAVPTSVSIELHVLAIGFVVGAALLLQFYNMLFFNLRTDEGTEGTALASGLMALSSGALFVVQVDSGWTWPIRVLPRQARKMERPAGRTTNTVFKPNVHFNQGDHQRREEVSSSSSEDTIYTDKGRPKVGLKTAKTVKGAFLRS